MSARTRVTVLMPVYNGGEHLREAIESILGQSFRDFEFLIIDDGSTDGSAQIVRSYTDPRIRLLHNGKNEGLIATLNRGLDMAAGEYVARMDCDDISLPGRLERQTGHMDSHPDTVACGTWFRKFGTVNKTVRWPTDPDAARCGLLFDATVAHPTVMVRKQIFDRLGLRYDQAYRNAEDYELWSRVAEHGPLTNLGEVLLRYRVHPSQVTQRAAAGQRESAGRVRLHQLRRLGLEPSPDELRIHQAVSTAVCDGVEEVFARGEEWLCRLSEANERTALFPEPAFSRVLVERWLTFAKKAMQQGHFSLRAVYFPDLLKRTGLGARFVVQSLLRYLGKG